jgi:capsular exopolysaccharide synthesis family protein
MSDRVLQPASASAAVSLPPQPAPSPSGGFFDDVRNLAGVARQSWRLIAVCTLVGLTIVMIYLAGTKSNYLATSRLLVITQGRTPLSVSGGESGRLIETHEDYLPTHALIIRSPTVVARALQSIDRNDLPARSVVERLTVTRPDPSAKVLLVAYKSPNKEEALKLIEAVLQSYQEFLDDNSHRANKDVASLLTKARDGLGKELQSLEQKYLELKRGSPTLGVDDTGRTFVIRRLDEWDRAANEAMIRGVQLKTQLELGRKLAADGASPWAITQALDMIGGGSASMAGQIRLGPRERLENELVDAEVQAHSGESLLVELERAAIDRTENPEELARLFYSQPEVEQVADELRLTRHELGQASRIARSSSDPSVNHHKSQIARLETELAEHWDAKRSRLEAMVREEVGLGEAKLNLAALKARERSIREKLDAFDAEELHRLEEEHKRLEKRLGPGDPKVVAIAQQIAQGHKDTSRTRLPRDLVHDLLAAVERSLETVESMRTEIRRRFDSDLAEARASENDRLQEVNLNSSLERHRSLFNAVVDQLKQVQLSADFGGITAQVIDPPNVVPDRPQIALLVTIALLASSGLGLGIAVIAERMDQRLHTLNDIRKALGIATIGLVPRLPVVDTPGGIGLLGHALPNSPLAEAYRVVRTQLDFVRRSRHLQVILITSPVIGDGKTTTASNLAISLAQAGRRVLLMDADIRRPSLHKIYECPRQPGLTEVLLGQTPSEQAIRSSSIYHLDLLTAGEEVANPAEVLLSPSLREFLNAAREVYDTILIDSPPLLPVTDPAILSGVADGIILVVQVSSLRQTDATRTCELLRTIGTHPLGMIVNKIDGEQESYPYYYYSRLPDSRASG